MIPKHLCNQYSGHYYRLKDTALLSLTTACKNGLGLLWETDCTKKELTEPLCINMQFCLQNITTFKASRFAWKFRRNPGGIIQYPIIRLTSIKHEMPVFPTEEMEHKGVEQHMRV